MVQYSRQVTDTADQCVNLALSNSNNAYHAWRIGADKSDGIALRDEVHYFGLENDRDLSDYDIVLTALDMGTVRVARGEGDGDVTTWNDAAEKIADLVAAAALKFGFTTEEIYNA